MWWRFGAVAKQWGVGVMEEAVGCTRQPTGRNGMRKHQRIGDNSEDRVAAV